MELVNFYFVDVTDKYYTDTRLKRKATFIHAKKKKLEPAEHTWWNCMTHDTTLTKSLILQPAAHNPQPATCTCNLQPAPATYNLQPATFNLQPAPATCNLQPAVYTLRLQNDIRKFA